MYTATAAIMVIGIEIESPEHTPQDAALQALVLLALDLGTSPMRLARKGVAIAVTGPEAHRWRTTYWQLTIDEDECPIAIRVAVPEVAC